MFNANTRASGTRVQRCGCVSEQSRRAPRSCDARRRGQSGGEPGIFLSSRSRFLPEIIIPARYALFLLVGTEEENGDRFSSQYLARHGTAPKPKPPRCFLFIIDDERHVFAVVLVARSRVRLLRLHKNVGDGEYEDNTHDGAQRRKRGDTRSPRRRRAAPTQPKSASRGRHLSHGCRTHRAHSGS